VDGISVQVPSCKYKPTTITNDSGNQESSSGVMAAKDTRHVTLVHTAVACVSLQISSPINSKFRLFSLSSWSLQVLQQPASTESVSIAINTTQNEGNAVDWGNFDFGCSGQGGVRPLDAHDH